MFLLDMKCNNLSCNHLSTCQTKPQSKSDAYVTIMSHPRNYSLIHYYSCVHYHKIFLDISMIFTCSLINYYPLLDFNNKK